MKRINITRAAAAGFLGIASLAIAADQKSNVTDPAKLPKFANVVIVNATAAQRAAAASHATPMVGQKAAVDSNGALRPLTLEESAALSVPAAEAASNAAAAGEPVAIVSSDGSPGMLLDESTLAYAVATVGPDGKVRTACVEDQPNGAAALKSAAGKTGVHKNEK
jgi:hypothetical protein